MSAVLERKVRSREVTRGAIRIDDVVTIYDPEGATVMREEALKAFEAGERES